MKSFVRFLEVLRENSFKGKIKKEKQEEFQKLIEALNEENKRIARMWVIKGFNSQEAQSWMDIGFSPTQAKKWKINGFKPKEAKLWKKSFDPKESAEWRKYSIPYAQAGTLGYSIFNFKESPYVSMYFRKGFPFFKAYNEALNPNNKNLFWTAEIQEKKTYLIIEDNLKDAKFQILTDCYGSVEGRKHKVMFPIKIKVDHKSFWEFKTKKNYGYDLLVIIKDKIMEIKEETETEYRRDYIYPEIKGQFEHLDKKYRSEYEIKGKYDLDEDTPIVKISNSEYEILADITLSIGGGKDWGKDIIESLGTAEIKWEKDKESGEYYSNKKKGTEEKFKEETSLLKKHYNGIIKIEQTSSVNVYSNKEEDYLEFTNELTSESIRGFKVKNPLTKIQISEKAKEFFKKGFHMKFKAEYLYRISKLTSIADNIHLQFFIKKGLDHRKNECNLKVEMILSETESDFIGYLFPYGKEVDMNWKFL
jgi:hypothetical protein